MIYFAGNGSSSLAQFMITTPDRWHLQGLRWTVDPPTEPGHYRAIDKLGRGVWVDVRKIKDHVYVDYGDGNAVELFNFTHWLGPLPDPEPPK